MSVPRVIGWLLGGSRTGQHAEATGRNLGPEEEARLASDRELEELVREAIRGALASGEATIVSQDPDGAELLAAELGVTIPPEKLAAARRALEERQAERMAASLPQRRGYPLVDRFDRERFRSLGHEAAAILSRFVSYGDDAAGELRDGLRLLAIAEELSYGGTVEPWSPGTPRVGDDPDYPWPELSWLPGYLLFIGRDMQRHAEMMMRR